MHIICGHTRQFVLVALLGGIVFRSGMFANGYKRIDIYYKAQEKINHQFFKDVEYDFTGKTPRFLIWPYGENVSAQPKCVGFEKEEAKFRCVKEYFEHADLLSNGYYDYRLYPVD